MRFLVFNDRVEMNLIVKYVIVVRRPSSVLILLSMLTFAIVDDEMMKLRLNKEKMI